VITRSLHNTSEDSGLVCSVFNVVVDFWRVRLELANDLGDGFVRVSRNCVF
jgi:hypothetical protein